MKRIFTLLWLLLPCIYGKAGLVLENVMYLTAPDAKPGQTAVLTLNLYNDYAVAGWSCAIYLPEGITIDEFSTDTGRYPKKDYYVRSTETDDGGILYLVYGTSCLTGKDGAIATIRVNIPNDFKPGEYNIELKRISLSDVNGQSLDVNTTHSCPWTIGGGSTVGDETEDTDISSLNNVIYLNKVEGFVGEEMTLPFQMKNTAAIRGFQFDLYLPEGVTAVKNAKGRIQGALSSGRLPQDDEHNLTIQEQADGAIRFLCSSLYDETFTGTEGEIATLRVIIDENLEGGDHPIVIKNMKLLETNISNFYETAYLKSTLNVSSYITGDVNQDRKVDVSDYTGIANHIMSIPQDVFIEKAADVDNNSVIDVADYTGVANIIMTGNIYGGSIANEGSRIRTKAAGYGENYIFVQAKEMKADEVSGAEIDLSLHMKNTAPIRGFQFDMYLPEGFTFVKNSKGRIAASLNSDRLPEDDEHALIVQEQTDGAVRFLCSSLYDEVFTGTEGEIATVKVKIAANIVAGNYTVRLTNLKLTETNINNFYETDNVDTDIVVLRGTPKVCAKPTISYADGKLTFRSETEDAVCHSTITDSDIASYSSNEVQLNVTYNISVYATKEGYEDSEVTTATLCWIAVEPQTEGLEDGVAEMKALPILVQAQGGIITIQGASDGTPVSVYSTNGMLQGTCVAESGIAAIRTSLQAGAVALVKVGEKAIKVSVK